MPILGMPDNGGNERSCGSADGSRGKNEYNIGSAVTMRDLAGTTSVDSRNKQQSHLQ